MSSYSTDLVISKLSNLNDTQDSITSVSQWVLFHRRVANETVQTWLQCLREASTATRKLNLVYLANDVVQQSRARKKDEFPRTFSGVIAEAMEIAYRGSTADVQNKLRRVFNVWRERSVFEPVVLGEIDRRLDVTHAAQSQSSASSAYSSLLQSDHLPSPEIYLPRLTQLLKSLSESKEATLAVVKARNDLVKSLETHLERQKRELTKSQSLLAEVEEQVRGVQETRDEVQNMMQSGGGGGEKETGVRSTTPEIEPPQVEALTPPEMGVKAEEMGDQFAGLESLDPEIVALLKADMGLRGKDGTKSTMKGPEDVEEYGP